MRHWIRYVLVCRRRGHSWGSWRPADELLPGRDWPEGWLARECRNGCGQVEMPQPG